MSHTATLISEDRGRRWSVDFQGERIVNRGRDPEHEACRALAARGVMGRIAFVHQHGTPGLSMDIARGAGMTTVEEDRDGLRLRKFRPLHTGYAPPAAVAAFGGAATPSNQNGAVWAHMDRAA